MRIEHVALWVADLNRSASFYERYFGGVVHARYENQQTGFSSIFMRFTSGARLELMHRADIPARSDARERMGWAHIAVAVADRRTVDDLTERIRADGHPILGEPRLTGDGYYESVVQDPDGSRVEIIAEP